MGNALSSLSSIIGEGMILVANFADFANEEEKGHRWSLGGISDDKLDAVEIPSSRHPFVEDLLEDIFSDGACLYHLVDQHHAPRGE